jgi:hypothetical protein
MLVIFGITFVLNHYVFRLSPGENAVQSLSVGFPNFPAVGLPLLGSLMGPESAVSVAVSLAAGSIFISPLTLAVLEARGKATGSSPDLVVNALFRSVSKPVVIAPVAGLVVVSLGIHLNGVVSHALNLIGATTAGLACFVTGLVLSAQPLRLNANVGVCVFLKNIGFPLVAYAIALALGMSGSDCTGNDPPGRPTRRFCRHPLRVKLWSQVPGFRLHAYPQFSCKRHHVDGSNFSDFADEMRATKAEWQARNPKLKPPAGLGVAPQFVGFLVIHFTTSTHRHNKS